MEFQLIDNNRNEKEMPNFLQPESLHSGKTRHRRKFKISVTKDLVHILISHPTPRNLISRNQND